MKNLRLQLQQSAAHDFPQPSIFLRLPQVLEIFPVSKSAWYAGIKAGIYPKPNKLGQRSSAWSSESIRALIERVANDAGGAA